MGDDINFEKSKKVVENLQGVKILRTITGKHFHDNSGLEDVHFQNLNISMFQVFRGG